MTPPLIGAASVMAAVATGDMAAVEEIILGLFSGLAPSLSRGMLESVAAIIGAELSERTEEPDDLG